MKEICTLGLYAKSNNLFIYLVLGDPRTNQNPAILAIGVVFFRYHNVIAARIQNEHPEWSDEEIFQRSRRLVVAALQVRTNLDRRSYYCHLKTANIYHSLLFFVPLLLNK